MARLYFSAFKVISLSSISLLCADSILLSATQVHYHFNQDSSYIFAAANNGEGLAAYQLYKTNKNIYWLEEAAMAGHADAVWELHVQKNKHDKHYNNVWFEVALKNNYPLAILNQIEQFVTSKDWQSAAALLNTFDTQLTLVQDPSMSKLLEQLKESVYFFDNEATSLKKKRQPQIKFSFEDQQIGTVYDGKAWAKFVNTTSCEVNVLIYSFSNELANHSRQLVDDFYSLLPTTKNTICFSPPYVDYRLNRICEEDSRGLLGCDKARLGRMLQETVPISIKDKTLRLLVIGQNGRANSVGPLIYLDHQDTVQVLIHEVGHWLNLYDEYQIASSHQQIFCNETSPSELGLNLVVAPKGFTKSTLERQFNQRLWPVDTCYGSNNVAFKKYQPVSPMEYYDVALPNEYLRFYETPVLNPTHTNLDEFFK